MKRNILFRGLHTDGGGWVEGALIFYPESDSKEIYCASQTEFNLMENYEVIPETVGQFTGLTDKNGKKLFKGDRIKNKFGTYVIEFQDGCFWACNEKEEDNVPLYVHNQESEIIGNIHEK